jgi:hypothetical protein
MKGNSSILGTVDLMRRELNIQLIAGDLWIPEYRIYPDLLGEERKQLVEAHADASVVARVNSAFFDLTHLSEALENFKRKYGDGDVSGEDEESVRDDVQNFISLFEIKLPGFESLLTELNEKIAEKKRLLFPCEY